MDDDGAEGPGIVDGTIPEDAIAEDAIPLCPACLSETSVHHDFCQTCLAPLTFYAATGFYESIWASAWILSRTFQTAWPRMLHGWGATLVSGPNVIALGLLLLSLVLDVLAQSGIPGFDPVGTTYRLDDMTFVAVIVMGWVHAWLLRRTWGNVLRHRDVEPWPDEAAA